MILIMVGIAALVAGYVLVPVLRPRPAGGASAGAKVVAEALDAELSELELDLRAGKMTEEDYARAVAELQQRAQSSRSV